MMAQRKDTMRIIRQDAGFSAKLGFGGTTTAEEANEPKPVCATVEVAAAAPATLASVLVVQRATQPAPTKMDRVASGSAARGQVVYVALSLTTRQATLAEIWATVARCSVQFLIRRVAQGLREQAFDDWERDGMPDVDESRGARGKHPTSVTLTLQPQFAADLAAKHDPLGMLGLARVMGPAYRARFHAAFDKALAKAKIQMVNEGIET